MNILRQDKKKIKEKKVTKFAEDLGNIKIAEAEDSEDNSEENEHSSNLFQIHSNQNSDILKQKTIRFKRHSLQSNDITKFYFTYDYQNGTGELYMRVGTAIFSVCALISSSLRLVQMVEAYFNNYSAIIECKLTFTVTIVAKIFCILFIFIQSFFIFKYANIVIHFGKNTAILGLMHIVCTNFSLFTRTVVAETVSEIMEIRHALSKNHHHVTNPIKLGSNVDYLANSTFGDFHRNSGSNNDMSDFKKPILKIKHLGCINVNSFRTNISIGIQEAQEKISEYLYPCVIEYSLIAMTIFYILWASIKSRYNPNNKYGSYDIHPSQNAQNRRDSFSQAFIRRGSVDLVYNRMNNLINEKPQINKFTIDCGKSTTGLIFKILKF